jgi:PAS domain S-box-containing protein
MDIIRRKEDVWQYTIIALVITSVLTLSEVVIGLTSDAEATYTVKGVFILLRNMPVFWLILLGNILIPVGVYLLANHLSRQIDILQQNNEQVQDRMGLIKDFSQQLIHEKYEVDFPVAGEDDILGKSLLDLRDTLKVSKENNQKLRKEEEQRSWIAEGSAHFSEILRNHIHDPEQLSFKVIKDLTKSINAIQGGFYLLDDTDPNARFFNLAAFFAYDRRKFTDHQIKWGDGLVGTCALEQKIIHLKNVPDTYITVTSGLGESNPNSLLIVPMQYEDQIYGVLEFASFGKFEPNHIALVEKTAESVAATLSAVRTNQRTARLLEESKAQTHTLSSHEEEMRQNMEELQATQEEAMRQSQRFLVLEDAINQNLIRIEFDTEGRLISANNLFYAKFEFSSDSRIEGKPVTEFISEENRDGFKSIWSRLLQNNEPYRGYLKHVTRTGKDLWTMGTLSVSKNEEASEDKILYLAIDASIERNQNRKNELIVETIDNTGIKLELDINGNLLDCSDNFIQIFKLSQKDIKSLVIFDLISSIELEVFNKRWDSIIKGNGSSGIFRCKTSAGGDVWLTGTFNPVYSMAHEVECIVFAGHDITREKQLEDEVRTCTETLKKQEKLLKEGEKELFTKLRDTKAELLNQFKETERIKNINERILEDAPEAIITTGSHNRVVFFNKAAELLWKTDRKEVLQQDITVLFPEKLTDKDELLGSFVRPGDNKITGQRRNSRIIDKSGKEKAVMILLTKARVDNENAYTAFIQPAD